MSVGQRFSCVKEDSCVGSSVLCCAWGLFSTKGHSDGRSSSSNPCRKKGWGVVLTAQILRIGTPHADTAPPDPSDSRTCAVVSRVAQLSESEDAGELR